MLEQWVDREYNKWTKESRVCFKNAKRNWYEVQSRSISGNVLNVCQLKTGSNESQIVARSEKEDERKGTWRSEE